MKSPMINDNSNLGLSKVSRRALPLPLSATKTKRSALEAVRTNPDGSNKRELKAGPQDFSV